MTSSFASYLPALGLLLMMGLLAWVVQWVKKRTTLRNGGAGADIRLVSQLAIGPQQRVVVVEVQGAQGPVQLTLGVTPQHVRTLHTQAVGGVAAGTARKDSIGTPSYAAVAQALSQVAPAAKEPHL